MLELFAIVVIVMVAWAAAAAAVMLLKFAVWLVLLPFRAFFAVLFWLVSRGSQRPAVAR